MLANRKRKEVVLDVETILLLQQQAEREGRNLKNYMEHILKEKANDFEVSDSYKIMMDKMLLKHENGKVNYTNWEDVKANLLDS